MGPYPDATAVFDIDAIGLTNLASRLNHGLDPGGNEIGEPTRFVIGVGVNPAAVDLAAELRRFEWKVDAGAEFAVRNRCSMSRSSSASSSTRRHVHIPIIAGIWPLVSVRNAEFLANEVPGVTVPDVVVQRMRRPTSGRRTTPSPRASAIAREMLEQVRDKSRAFRCRRPSARSSSRFRYSRGRLAGRALRVRRTGQRSPGARAARERPPPMYFDKTLSPIDTPMNHPAHRSRLQPRRANETLACMANLIQHLVGQDAVVRYAHMELAEPTIAQGFAQCAESGADEVIAFPYMLAPGRHSTADIPRMVGAAAAAYPSVTYQVTAPLASTSTSRRSILARAGLAAVAEPASTDCCWNPAGRAGACGDACRA